MAVVPLGLHVRLFSTLAEYICTIYYIVVLRSGAAGSEDVIYSTVKKDTSAIHSTVNEDDSAIYATVNKDDSAIYANVHLTKKAK